MYAKQAQTLEQTSGLQSRRRHEPSTEETEPEMPSSHDDEAPHCDTCFCLNFTPDDRAFGSCYSEHQQHRQQQRQSARRQRCALDQLSYASEERSSAKRREAAAPRSSMAIEELLREMNLVSLPHTDDEATCEPASSSRLERGEKMPSETGNVVRRGARARPNAASNCHLRSRRTYRAMTTLSKSPSFMRIERRTHSCERRPASSNCLREQLTVPTIGANNEKESARYGKPSDKSWLLPLTKKQPSGKYSALLGAGDDNLPANLDPNHIEDDQNDDNNNNNRGNDDDHADGLILAKAKEKIEWRGAVRNYEEELSALTLRRGKREGGGREFEFMDEAAESRPATAGETELELARRQLIERMYKEARELRRLQRRLDGHGSPSRSTATMTSARPPCSSPLDSLRHN